jgi:rhodanese-related sulfurtransferase
MKQPLPLMLPVLILALAACGGEPQPGHNERKSGGFPFGFELAAAATGEAADVPVVEVSPDEVARLLERGTIRLIDIRTAEEVAESGTIPGAEHIAMDRLDAALLENDDGREVVLYCRSGSRSLAAATALAGETGKPVAHMPGGILAWEDRVRMAAACQEAGGQDC